MDICNRTPVAQSVAQSCRNYYVPAVGVKRILAVMFSETALGAISHLQCFSLVEITANPIIDLLIVALF